MPLDESGGSLLKLKKEEALISKEINTKKSYVEIVKPQFSRLGNIAFQKYYLRDREGERKGMRKE